MGQRQIKDLIEVPEVKTVIQLSDIESEQLRDFLTRSFLITDEVKQILTAFFNNVTTSQGRGYFLEGNFGSGKSHLLSVLSLLFNYQQAWQPLIEQEPALAEFSTPVLENDYIILNISLVEHSNKEYLEDIVLTKLNQFLKENGLKDYIFSGEAEFLADIQGIIKARYQTQLKQFLQRKDLKQEEFFTPGNLYLVEEFLAEINLSYRFQYQRSQIFAMVEELMEQQGYQGLVILVDELSEFLRSKSDGRRFNEDIRFLQFLGEYTAKQPCWLVASLQEEIEKTGDITPEAFNKIKDRFKRFYLTGHHIEELVAKRLINLKAGAKAEIAEIYDEYKNYFQNWPVTKKEFIALYPVHPLTIKLLDNLKPLFSRHRGIVDFIHYRLKGDLDRGLEGMLTDPATQLLTGEQIFDHFLDRIRERMETANYYEKVFQYYRQEIADILPQEDVAVGLKLIKLLILFKIAPIDKEYSVRDISNMLLVKVTELESRANYEYINNLLERLFNHGAYLKLTEGKSILENVYQIDLKADINLIIERKTEFIKDNLFNNDRRIFTKLGQEIKHRSLPLNSFFEQPKAVENIFWQQTARRGYRIFMPLTELAIENINSVAQKLKESEIDFALLIGYPQQLEKQRKYLKDVLLAELSEVEKEGFAFWLPQKLEQQEFLTEALARMLLLEDYQADNTATGRQIRDNLTKLIKEDFKQVEEIILTAYYQGQILLGNGEIINPDSRGYQYLSDLMQSLSAQILGQRFPKHEDISPYQSMLTQEQIANLEKEFLAKGELQEFKGANRNLKQVIDSYLKPMQLVKKTKSGYRLQINSESNHLLREFFKLLEEEKTALEELYWQFRKGKYGLIKKQFRLLVLVLLYSGYLTAYSEQQKISLKNLSINNFARIKYLGYGELIANEFQRVLANCSLLPPRFKDKPFSLPLQHKIWDYLVSKKRKRSEQLSHLRQRLADLAKQEVLAEFDLEQMQLYVAKEKDLLAEIKVSYSSDEGLERFAAYYRNLPNIDQYLAKVAKIEEFIAEKLSQYRQMKSYLRQVPETISDELMEFYSNLKQSLREEALLYDDDFWQKFNQSFAEFKKLYSEEYFKAHQRQLGQDRFKAYQQVKESRSYQLLNLFNQLDTISVSDDLIKINRQLAKALNHQCQGLDATRLTATPLCECGFKLEDKIELPAISELKQAVERGIIQYLKQLQSPEIKAKITDYLANMEAVGKKRFARPIRKLLELNLADNDLLKQLEQLMNRRLIKRLNQALSEDIAIVSRDLDSLYENLVGRTFSPEQLKTIFNDWLKEADKLNDKTYIKVEGGEQNRTDSKEQDLLKSYLNDYFPDLLALNKELGAARFSYLILLKYCQQEYNLEPNQILAVSEVNELADYLHGEHQQSLIDLVQHLKTEQEEELIAKLLNTAERFKLTELVYNQLNSKKASALLDILAEEEFLLKLLEKISLKLIKLSENKQLDSTELKEISKKIKQLGDKQFLFAKKKRLVKLLDSYFALAQSRLALDISNNPVSYQEWEELYGKHLASLEYHLAQFKELADKLSLVKLLPIEKLEQTVKRLIQQYQKQFDNFRQNLELNGELTGDKSQIMDIKELVTDKYPSIKKNLNSQQGYLILLDGLRWDIWQVIKQQLNEKISWRQIESASLMTELPSNTETQLEKIRESSFSGKIISPTEFSGQAGDIIKCSFIDDKVHTVKGDYAQFITEISFQVENRLLPLLKKIPQGSPVLLFGDHGYRINDNFREENKYETPRYLHGGSSIFEMIVPWAVYYLI